jgi:hypothetical protein
MQNENPFDADGLQWLWSAHSIGLAETCLYKYYLTKVEGWAPARKSVHLIFGGHYADAIEAYHKLVAAGEQHDNAVRTVVQLALEATWDREAGAPWQSDHNKKNRETLIRSIVWYLEEWKDDPASTIILADGTPAAELSFKLDLDNGMVLRGKFDRLCEFSGEPFVMDQKTTGGGLGQFYFDQWSPDIQMSAYTFAGEAIWNIPVKGVILDVAEIAVGFTRFARGFVHRSKGSLQEWFDQSMMTIERARNATRERVFPMNRTACNNFGGCQFRGICSRSPEVRPNFLRGDFVQAKPEEGWK